MKALALALLVSAFALGSMTAPAVAQSMSACEAKAVSNPLPSALPELFCVSGAPLD
jgi:hypothetical protein